MVILLTQNAALQISWVLLLKRDGTMSYCFGYPQNSDVRIHKCRPDQFSCFSEERDSCISILLNPRTASARSNPGEGCTMLSRCSGGSTCINGVCTCPLNSYLLNNVCAFRQSPKACLFLYFSNNHKSVFFIVSQAKTEHGSLTSPVLYLKTSGCRNGLWFVVPTSAATRKSIIDLSPSLDIPNPQWKNQSPVTCFDHRY